MSFMDRKNILSEGFFDRLLKLFKQDKKIAKDPKVKKAMKDYKKAETNLRNSVNDLRRDLGLPEIK